MAKKSPAVQYYTQKIKTMRKSDIIKELEDAPLSRREFDFMLCILERMTYKELAERFHRTEIAIYKMKRALFERLHRYDLAVLRR